MFWSSNYTANRELKLLLLEKNVTLTQVLEADDILQECKANYQTLCQFLTRPDILSELITLVTEEPPKNVELSLQYRHANIACEVLTSNLPLLRDRLSSNTIQMNRLCDFVNKEPPLNPLLASYFSKTIKMLLEQSRKTDWYLHHIVSLRVLDFFKSRRDFVPNLLRHMSTSAICDTFRSFLQIIDNTNIILEWLDEYHFLDCLIQIICGTYVPEELHSAQPDTEEKAINEPNEKLDTNHNSEPEETAGGGSVLAEKEAKTNGEREELSGSKGKCDAQEEEEAARRERARRTRGVAAANAAALLCDIALDCALYNGYVYGNPWAAGKELVQRLRSEETVRRLLQGCFTSPAGARRHAVVHACRLLLALLKRARPVTPPPNAEAVVADGEEKYREVELAVAPHLPLLHRALLKDVDEEESRDVSVVGATAGVEDGARRVAGATRVHVAALVARLALSDVDDVPTALISLGTAGVLIDLSFSCSHNNFLHAQLVEFVRNARNNTRFGERYTTHLIEECNLLSRLMDAFEENESGNVRAGYMGHVVLLLGELHEQPLALPPGELLERWTVFREQRLKPLLLLHHAPLGGVYPNEDFQEVLKFTYDDVKVKAQFVQNFGMMNEDGESGECTLEDGEGYDTENSFQKFQAQASQHYNDNVWDDTPADDVDDLDVQDDGDDADDVDEDRLHEETQRVLSQTSPWEDAGPGTLAAAGSSDDAWGEAEGWAQFDTPVNKYLLWASSQDPESLSSTGALQKLGLADDDKDALTILLAHKMLAFHNMAPEHRHQYETQEGDLETQTHAEHDGQGYSAVEREDQSTQDGQAHTDYSKDNQSAQNEKNQSLHDGQNQSAQGGHNQSVHDGQNRSAQGGHNQSAHDDQNQSPRGGNDQKAHDGQNQSSNDCHNQSENDRQNLSIPCGHNQSVHDDQNQSTQGGQIQSAHDGHNQGAHDGQIQSTHSGNNQTGHDRQNENVHDDQNQNAHEASSAYDSPSAVFES